MKKLVQFGEKVEGYNILVLNERNKNNRNIILATFISLIWSYLK
jgi:hypothetical protein